MTQHRIWLVLLLTSCGKVVGDLPVDGNTGADAPIGGADARPGTPDARLVDAPPLAPTTIQQLRMNPPANGTPIALRGVVVIARETSGGNGALILQDDADGGDFSGITLFCNFGDGMCNLTRSNIDNMPIGRVLDVNGSFDIVQPQGMPTPPPAPRIVRATVTQSGNVATLVPRLVSAADVAPGQWNRPQTRAMLWTYIKVDGPVDIMDVRPPSFSQPCPNPLDGGPSSGNRAVIAHAGTADIAIGVGRGDPQQSYCLFQCELTCMNDLTTDDSFSFIQGVLDTFHRPNDPEALIIAPARNTDIGAKL